MVEVEGRWPGRPRAARSDRASSESCSRFDGVADHRYVGLLLLLIGGAGAATINDFWTKPWVLGSIVVLLVVIVLMYALGTGYYMPLRRQLAGMDGAAPMTDAELAARLDERRPRLLAGIGSLGLLLIIWMMVLKPGA